MARVANSVAAEIIGRNDISQDQKQKILYDNAVVFFGEP